jgi:hypothetical protein
MAPIGTNYSELVKCQHKYFIPNEIISRSAQAFGEKTHTTSSLKNLRVLDFS